MAMERGSLSLGQRLVLLVAWMVSCGFVYVLGVYVGKGMRDRGPIHPGVSLPVDAAVPPAPPAEAQAPLTFYDVLGTQGGGRAATRPEPPDTHPAPSGTMNEQKLAASPAPSPPVEKAAAAAVDVAPVAATATARPSPAATPPPSKPAAPAGPATGAGTPPLAAVKPPAPPAAAPTPPPAVRSPAPPSAPPPPAATGLPPQVASGRWTVYANPSRDKLAVDYERAALRAKGYPAEVVTVKRDGDTWYRIRVGRYATEAQAEEASRKLRSDGVGHAFVQSE